MQRCYSEALKLPDSGSSSIGRGECATHYIRRAYHTDGLLSSVIRLAFRRHLWLPHRVPWEGMTSKVFASTRRRATI